MKITSCGIIIQNQKGQVLGCSPYGRKDGRHDVPKGKMEVGETPIETALRECFEETGLDLSQQKLTDTGIHKYIKTKDLHLFYCKYEVEDISNLVCTTFCEVYGRQVPEIVDYKWINKDKIEDEFFVPLVKIFKKIELI